jgi:hypothetical protein
LAQALARHVKPEVAAFVRQVFSLHEPGNCMIWPRAPACDRSRWSPSHCGSCFRRQASSCGST